MYNSTTSHAAGTGTEHVRKQSLKVTVAGAAGTIIEYYDFAIYGYMATMIAVHFFVLGDPTASLLGTFATFAVAFFLRIPGGILFGHIGDKYGRKRALSWTIGLMVTATVLIGLIPSYATLGLWATLLLVLARCLQGISAGGEIAGAVSFVAEHAPNDKRATRTSMVSVGATIGSLVASLIALMLTSMFPVESVETWAWRLPFILSLPLGILGWILRNRTEESPRFAEQSEETDAGGAEMPVMTVLRNYPGTVVKIVGLCAMHSGAYWIATVYVATYLQTTAGFTSQVAYLSSTIALIIGIATTVMSGRLSDRIGRKATHFIGAGTAVVSGLPIFMMMQSGNTAAAIFGHCLLMVCVALIMGTGFTSYTEMLPTRIRYSGIALSTNTAQTLLGGPAPFIATALIAFTGNPLAPAGFFVFCALLTLAATFFMKETKGIELPN